jgi:TIR domain-containing protein/uncharacterized protein DUF6557
MTVTLKDVFNRVSWDQLLNTLTVRLIERQHRYIFKNVYKYVRALEPIPSDFVLIFKRHVHDNGLVSIDIAGRLRSAPVGSSDDLYDMILVRWAEWLGSEISAESFAVRDADIVAASVYDMSFLGSSEAAIKRRNIGGVRGPRVFLSHASEDKDLARPLASEMEECGLEVWFDESELMPGDSLRKKIAQGISKTHAAVVVLSPSFFKKPWTERELSGIVSMETTRQLLIIPIWHGVTLKQVARYDPSLADRFALSSSALSIEQIASSINEVVRARAKPR